MTDTIIIEEKDGTVIVVSNDPPPSVIISDDVTQFLTIVQEGPQGPAGPKGDNGTHGDDGVQGPIGPTGPQGVKGDTGAQGPQGNIGPAGPQGDTGPQGVPGVSNIPGPTGPTGPEGPQGPKGDTGATGADGVSNIPGPTGPQGPVGADGAVGPTGPQGPAGAVGNTGPQGPQGVQGPVGPTGPAGDTTGVALLAGGNAFVGNQSINGTLTTSGIATFNGGSAVTSFLGLQPLGMMFNRSGIAVGEFIGIDFGANGSAGVARIAMQFTAAGSYLVFGTSNDYANGITNQAILIDQLGNTLFGGGSSQFNGQVTVVQGINAGGLITASAGILSNGIVEIGNPSDPRLRFHYHGVSYWDFYTQSDGAFNLYNTSGGYYGFHRSTDGGMYFPGNVIAYWSDARLKEAVEPLDGYEARIMGLRPVSFQWNERGRKLTNKKEGDREFGFIAQEVQRVDERFVTENKCRDEGDEPYLTVKKDEMIADLVAMVQNLTLRVRELEAKISA